ncbi:PREDICTED: kinetochore-associated protein 1 [Polistes dominula]|uniref:Kinetochore-associated protein 1 n=1 Tax=Polistes dominula TaxID=743375 RepID=A0ABM1IQR0_POLDO|nr:PREDICTED: kinetochore-associated protein 1 [Polistes dominula]
MALWNKVLSGFDTEDETINFGKRQVVESKTSIYETVTLASIQTDGEVQNEPTIQAFLQYTRLCIVVDKSITIFEDETCQNILLNIAFDFLITSCCISKNEEFLYVLLENGMLFCLYLIEETKILFSINTFRVTNNHVDITKILLDENGDDSMQIILVNRRGIIYRITFPSTEELINNVIDYENTELQKTFEKSLQVDIDFDGTDKHEKFSAVVVASDISNFIFIEKDKCFTWPSKNTCDLTALSFGYQKIQILKKFNAMLCLCSDNLMRIVCTKTLIGKQIYKEKVSDFMLIIDESDNYSEILLLLKNENKDTLTLRLVSFPDFEEKFQITNVPLTTALVNTLNSSIRSILFIEKITNGKYIDTIRIKSIVESAPSLCLERLLKRRRFEEAENFAKRFNLSLESIHISKAMLLVEQLNPWSKKTSEEINLNVLINTLNQINNLQFIITCCTNALMIDYKQMKKLLLYARQRIVDNNKDNMNMIQNEHINLLKSINTAVHKLETFEILYETLIVNEYTLDQTLNEWLRFSRADLFEECQIRLTKGELEAAALIWSRHLPDIEQNLSIQTVRNILQIIPDKISLNVLWAWLSNFMPSLLSLLPSSIDDMVTWGCQKIISLENFQSEQWPQIGIDFANKFLALLKFNKNPPLYFYKENINESSTFKSFMHIVQSLHDLKVLKNDYRLKVPINSYIGDPIDVIHLLLNKIPIEGIHEFINKFLKQYILNHSLENDVVFSSYIQKLIYKFSKDWWSWEEVVWERRVAVVITFIHDIQNRLKITLEILKKAPIPWSPTISQLAEISTKFEHPLSTKIKIERDYVPIKFILKKYGYAKIGINDYYLTRGNFDIPFEILNNMDDDVVLLYCCERIVNYIVSSFTLKDIPESIENYFECLSWIDAKLQEMLMESKIKRYYYQSIVKRMNAVKDLYRIKKEFNIIVPLGQLYAEKDQILQTCIANLSNELNVQSLSTMTAYAKAVKLGDILKLPRLKVISVLLESTQNFDILQHLTGFDKSNVDITADECKYVKDVCRLTLNNVKVNVDTAKIIKSLCACALNCCTGYEIECILKYYNLADLYSKSLATNNTNTTNENTEKIHKSQLKLYTMYNDLVISLEPLFFTVIKDVLSIVINYTNFKIIPNKTTTTTTIINEDFIQEQNTIEELLNDLLMKMKNIITIHKEYALFQIIKTLYFSFCFSLKIQEDDMLNKLKSMLSQSIQNLLKRVINAPKFDLLLGLTCLFMLSDDEASKSLTDYAKYSTVSILACEYFNLQQNQSQLESVKWYKMLHYWAQRLTAYSIAYREIFSSDNDKKRQILTRLMNNNNNKNTISILEDFCKSFGFDIDDCLKLYLKVLLNNWNPTFKISYCNGEKELQIPEEEVNKLRAKCTTVVNKIIDKSTFKQYAKSILSEINFYHYEAFIILLDLAEIESSETRNYFCFLQNYTRCGQPTLVEQEEWVRLSPEYKSLPAISEHRLPFLPKIEIWKLITSELNLKSYEKWLTIVPIIKLEPHILCTVAIKEAVIQEWGPLNSRRKTMEWSIYPKNNIFLQNVLKCIERMGSDALYYATAALYYVVNYTPPGADQVAAIKQCFKFAELAVKRSTNFEEGLLEKIRFKYERFTAEHILRSHGLGKENYISLISYPHELVHALYMDDSIPLRYQSAINIRPDINSAIDALGHLFNLNLIKLRFQLLQEWLQPDAIQQVGFNQSVTDVLCTLKQTNHSLNSETNLCRACYILQHGNVDLSVHFLIDIGFNENPENDYSTEMRYRALDILQSIIDPTTLQDITKREITTVRQYTKILKYVSKLEALGLGYDITTFETSSKHELVQMLLNTQYHSQQALILIAEICMDYNIYDCTIWDKSLTEMARLVMVIELMEILPRISRTSIVTTCKGYKLAWQVVILEPFSKMDIKPSSDQIDDCITAFCLLYSCPVTYELKFNDILNYCFISQQPHLAVAFLPYLNATDKLFLFARIKTFSNVQNIIDDLNDLSSKGILGIPYCITILKQNVMKEEPPQ